LAAAVEVAAQQAQQGGGASFVAVPNPLSGENPRHPLVPRGVPEVGKPFRDARFGTTLTRVTQRPGLRHEYARYDPFNKDQSRIVLHDVSSGDHYVYRTGTLPFDRKENLLKTLAVEQPRWDPVDPDVLWGFDEFRILTVNVRTDTTTVVKDFSKDQRIAPILKAEPDLYRITTRDEGESSRDKRYWALLLQGSKEDYRSRYLFTWDRQTDRVLGIRKLDKAEEIDWVGMSWLGNWVLIGADPGTGRISGLTLADRALTRFHKLAHATGHSDVGLDVHGNEVLVMQSSRTDHVDMIPLDWKTKPIHETGDEYAGTNRTRLVRLFYSSESPFGFNSGIHISCNTPGYCVISTYTDPNVKEQNWLDRSIILIRLDAASPKAFHLAKVHGTNGAYWEETHATITNDGSKVVWATNWNQEVGKERVFMMQLDMPADWQGAPAGTAPPKPSGQEAAIRALAQQFVAALRKQNPTPIAQLADLLDDEFLQIRPDGRLYRGKQTNVAVLRSTAAQIQSTFKTCTVRYEIRTVRVAAGMATVFGMLTTDGRLKQADQPVHTVTWETLVFAKRAAGWRLVQAHSSFATAD
jgi:ketosteroid isomerase-like protein